MKTLLNPAMKKLFLSGLIIFLIMNISFGSSIDQVLLMSGWKIHFGDNPAWKSPDYDDSGWADVSPVSGWDYLSTGEDYNGYGWYRIRFFLPEEMKENLGSGDSLYIDLGRVDDNDETYLNGSVVGRNATNTADCKSDSFANIEGFYQTYRKYSLPVSDPSIRWGAVNTLAIRVYDIWLGGGMFNAEPRVAVDKGWSRRIDVSRINFKPRILHVGEKTDVVYQVKNRDKDHELNAWFIIDVFSGKNDVPVDNQIKKITVEAGKTADVDFSFTPLVSAACYMSYKIIEESTNYTFGSKDLFGFMDPGIRVLDQPVDPVVKDKVAEVYVPVRSDRQKIGGYLGPRVTLNIEKGLVEFPQELLEPYITGKLPPWPVGEFLGKLVNGGTMMLSYEKDDDLLKAMETIVLTWLNTQKDDGYLGTQQPGAEWQGWDVWDHKYVILGLVKFYALTGYKPALDAARKIGDLLCKTFGDGPGRRDLMYQSYHAGLANGSILEPMVYLYKYTGDQHYLDFCQYVLRAYEQDDGPKIVSELNDRSGTVIKVGNGKGYEMLSCLIGMVQMYKVTGDEALYHAALKAWDDIAKNRLYITGTSTSDELFRATGDLPAGLDAKMGEGCVTAHWIYFSKELFKLNGGQKFMDEIGKSLYNHLLAAQHPVTDNIVYYCALQDKKWYMPPTMYLGPPLCCHTSVKRCIAQIPELTFYQHGNEIGVLLYNTSEASVSVAGSKGEPVSAGLKLNSNFPLSNQAEISVTTLPGTEFTLALRVPAWTDRFTARIGKTVYEGKPGEFLKIQRKWKPKDRVLITMDFPVRVLDGGQSYPGYSALKYGDQVLAVDADVNNLKDFSDVVFRKGQKPALKKYDGPLPDGMGW